MWFYECREPCETSAAAADLDGGCCLHVDCMFYDTSRCTFSNGVAVIGVFHCRSQIDLEVGLLLDSVPFFLFFYPDKYQSIINLCIYCIVMYGIFLPNERKKHKNN